MSMQAVWYEQKGVATEVLQFGEREMPIVEYGDVLVSLYSSAVNPSGIKK